MILYVCVQMYDTCYVMTLVMCALIVGIVAHLLITHSLQYN